LQTARASLHLLGTSPLIMNRFTEKSKRQILLPPRTQNRAARATTLKHVPLDEFRASVYRCRDGDAPTAVHLPSNCVKKAMAQAAIDTPGATRAEVGRLVTILSETVHLYGIPHLHMSMVRQAGISKTPDIRTRAYFPRWACQLDFRYIRDLVTLDDVLHLAMNAGLIVGIGDGRQEKGTFSFGCWEVVSADHPEWKEIVAQEGREAQLAALENPPFADEDSAELMGWYEVEVTKRRDPLPPKKQPPQQEKFQ
jgi:hypothetical protein